MLSRFYRIPKRNEQTDERTGGQTDREIIAISILRVSMLTCDENGNKTPRTELHK